MQKFRKKPVEIEAIQLITDSLFDVMDFMGNTPDLSHPISSDKFEDYKRIVERDGLKIETLEGTMLASIGDWIIKAVNGEFYPCKPDIFEKTYDRVES